MTEASVWIVQSRSDLKAMNCLHQSRDEELYCQVVAKAQQAVEKSVKALQISFHGMGYQVKKQVNIHEVLPVLDMMVRFRLPGNLGSKLLGLTNPNNRRLLADLETLIPKGRNNRNTEYPFQNKEGDWISPADRGTFKESEVEIYRGFALRMSRDAGVLSHL